MTLTSEGTLPVSMDTALSSDIDSIDAAKMSKGGIVVAHDAIGPQATGGVTTNGTPTITGLSSTIQFKVGDTVTVSAGFASQTQTILAIPSSSEVTVGNNSNANQTGVTVTLTVSPGNEIDCRGFNTISVECAVSDITSGNWLIEILGSALSGGTFGNCFAPKDDGTFIQQKTPLLNANGNTTYYFRGIPNYVKIAATRTTDGTLTCTVTPMNL
jgi:hypothetical protein